MRGVLITVEGVEGSGKSTQCWLWYRDLLSCQAGADDRLRVFGAAAASRADGHSLDEVLAGLTACREAYHALQGNVSPRLTVEVLLSRLVPGKTKERS